MATFTTEQATNFLRECLARPKNPTPFVIIEQAHKTQRFAEIMTRLQGHFGQHESESSLWLIARDAVCKVYLETLAARRAEQVANYKGWEARRVAACRRVDAGRYDYLDPQAEDDGISLAAIDTEMGQLQNEYGFTAEEVAAIEMEVSPEDLRNVARIAKEKAALCEIADDRPYIRHMKAVVRFHVECMACRYKIVGKVDAPFARELHKKGWVATDAGLLCHECASRQTAIEVNAADVKVGDIFDGSPVVDVSEVVDDGRPGSREKGRKITCAAGGVFWFYDQNRVTVERVLSPDPLKIATCEKCGEDTTAPLIAVDKEDFDVRELTPEGWLANPAKTVARFICGKCCRG